MTEKIIPFPTLDKPRSQEVSRVNEGKTNVLQFPPRLVTLPNNDKTLAKLAQLGTFITDILPGMIPLPSNASESDDTPQKLPIDFPQLRRTDDDTPLDQNYIMEIVAALQSAIEYIDSRTTPMNDDDTPLLVEVKNALIKCRDGLRTSRSNEFYDAVESLVKIVSNSSHNLSAQQ